MDEVKVSIIIPLYNRWDLCHRLLLSLYQYIPETHGIEIIIVDDCSPEQAEISGGLSWWQKKLDHHKVRYHRHQTNKGFGATCNDGAKLADGSILVFVSTDVEIRGDFIDWIVRLLRKDSNVLIGGEVVDWKAGWNEFEYQGHKSFVPYANGWLLACTKEVWKELGGFDPLYGRFDFEDVDLSTTAWAKKVTVVPLHCPHVRHLGGQTISTLNVDRMNITRENRKKWLSKWEARFSELFDQEGTWQIHGKRGNA